jgi:hypothetical protein
MPPPAARRVWEDSAWWTAGQRSKRSLPCPGQRLGPHDPATNCQHLLLLPPLPLPRILLQVAECPVYVSLAEALAYCRLHSARVMSEAEHAAACQHEDSVSNLGGGRGSIMALREGGWEWTSTPLEPFPGSSKRWPVVRLCAWDALLQPVARPSPAGKLGAARTRSSFHLHGHAAGGRSRFTVAERSACIVCLPRLP